jgi:4-amino-4-deoxy-L-arabinose transferase-like glycosyltransferase
MNFFSTAWDRRKLFLFAVGLFLISRGLLLTAFPIFNDEAIYIQYAQRIHDNWRENRFISMAGEKYNDWKPPLQYWIAAPFIEWGNDPLLPARLIAVVASGAGLFGSYLFAKQLFGQPEALTSAFVYGLCPTVIFHNDQFVAETFLFSWAPLFYWTLLKATSRDRPVFGWAIASVFLGTALLLIKQSGYLLLAISVFLPFVRGRTEEKRSAQFFDRAGWKKIGLNLCLVLAVIFLCGLAADAVLPAQFNEVAFRFDRKWVMSASEVVGAPLEIWGANFRIIVDYVGAYYCWTLLPLLGLFFWRAVRAKSPPDLVLSCMFLTAAGSVVFLLRGFNEYLFNTAVIALLVPMSARAIVLAWQWRDGAFARWTRYGFLACVVITIAHWTYQDVLMGVSAVKYFERSTPWAKANYLEHWSSGFGVKEIVAILEKEKRPGIVITDFQWGNPRTALEIYGRKRFPNFSLVPVTPEFADEAQVKKIRDIAVQLVPVRFAIYSSDTWKSRERWIRSLERQMCEEREEIRAAPSQSPIIVCRF